MYQNKQSVLHEEENEEDLNTTSIAKIDLNIQEEGVW